MMVRCSGRCGVTGGIGREDRPGRHRQCGPRGSTVPPSDRGVLADVGPDDLRAQHGLVEAQLTVELLHGGGLGVQRDDGVDAFGVLVDLVGQAATSPDVDVLDGPTVLTDDVEVRVERGRDRALFEIRIEDDHYFVGTQSSLHLLRTQAATAFPWQEGCASAVRRSSGAGTEVRRVNGPTPTLDAGSSRSTEPRYQRGPGPEKSSSPGLAGARRGTGTVQHPPDHEGDVMTR